MIPEPKVDLILASDTIYTPATIRAFISVVNQIATPETSSRRSGTTSDWAAARRR